MILPTITTTSPNWKDKIKELEKIGLKEVNVFPTCLNKKEREELYKLLKTTGVEKIPFVHLKSDMELWELDYLVKNYKTEVFNTHTRREFAIPSEWQKYQKIIYIENTFFPLDEKEIQEFAGICLDFSHLEGCRRWQPERYLNDIKMVERYGCGCEHISPVPDWNILDKEEEKKRYHPHLLKNLSELDYLKRYPQRYFGKYIALEMDNSLPEQLEAKDYIKKILNK